MEYIEIMEKYRLENNFYTLSEMRVLCKDNTIYDFFSVLISKNVTFGKNNIIYPGVIMEADMESNIAIGNHNVFFNNTHLEAKSSGEIIIGNCNNFMNGGISVRSNMPNSKITFSNNGRYDGRINIFGNCEFGEGSQIIGTINVYNCTLIGGGSYNEKDPDRRAGIIKGFGTAKNIVVNMGMVINGLGDFNKSALELQSNYHSK
ncbi:hypothetical protein [Anaerocolumna sp.]|uniref:hypothetical protein n=1 Tax=Anaerocolumna sp. TaxID=2041569 RepID=UPI0028A5A679|nr:hypothetical protein [Anaerocolumna sp.]